MEKRAPLLPLLLIACAAPARALLLRSPSGALTALLADDSFPRPLRYTLAGAGALNASLAGWGHRPSLVINGGEATCGASGLVTTFAPAPDGSSTSFAVAATCTRHVGGTGVAPVVAFTLTGSAAARDDGAVPRAAYLDWAVETVAQTAGDAMVVRSLDLVGVHFLSLHPAADRAACMYRPDDREPGPDCAGDSYYADSWANGGMDEVRRGKGRGSARGG